MKKTAILFFVIITLILIGNGCEEEKEKKKQHYVTIFLLDSTSGLTKNQRSDNIFSTLRHVDIVHRIILDNCQPDNLDFFDLDKKKEEKTDGNIYIGDNEDYHTFDKEKYYSELEKIIKYTDKHPEEKIIVNMSFRRYYHPLLELLSKDERSLARARSDLKEELIKNGVLKDENSIDEYLKTMKKQGWRLDKKVEDAFKEVHISMLKIEGKFADEEAVAKIAEKIINDLKEEVEITEEEIRERAKEEDLIRQLRNKGVIMVAAAGNDNIGLPTYPAAFEGVIAVGAHNWARKKTSYSNYGKYIDISTTGSFSSQNGIIITKAAGTSFAVPKVVAVIAKMFELADGRNIDPMSVLQNSARDITGDKYADKGLFGVGTLDRKKALNKIDPMYDEREPDWADDPERIAWFGSIVVIILLVFLLKGSGFNWKSVYSFETTRNNPYAPKPPKTEDMQRSETRTASPPPPIASGSEHQPRFPFTLDQNRLITVTGKPYNDDISGILQLPTMSVDPTPPDYDIVLAMERAEQTILRKNASKFLHEATIAIEKLVILYNGYRENQIDSNTVKQNADAVMLLLTQQYLMFSRIDHKKQYIAKITAYITLVQFIQKSI